MKYVKFPLASIAAVILSTLSGCGGQGCPPEVHPGMILKVQDSVGMPVPLCGAAVYAYNSEGDLVDYLEFFEDSCDERVSSTYILQGMHGSYQVTVRKDGYEDAIVDVVIKMGSSGCYPETVDIIAQLEPH